MKRTQIGIGIVLLLATGCSDKAADEAAAEPVLAEAKNLQMTIYNAGLSQVRDVRSVSYDKGSTEVVLDGISTGYLNGTEMFDWPGKTDAQIAGATYEPGADRPEEIPERLIGRTVEAVWYGDNGRPGERVTGTLEAFSEGGFAIRKDDQLFLSPDATLVVNGAMASIARPRLTTTVSSPNSGSADLALTYVTSGLSWNADYTAKLSPNSATTKLECWASVTNNTRTAFRAAEITLAVGQPNFDYGLARRGRFYDGFAKFSAMTEESTQSLPAAAAPVQMGQLHAYPIKERATLQPSQTRRLPIVVAGEVPLNRFEIVDLPYLYTRSGGYPEVSRLQGRTEFRFTNNEKGGLGMPLPGGSIRVYEADKNGAPRFIGSGYIPDMPKGATNTITLGQSFDITGERTILSAAKSGKTVTQHIRVVLKNAKDKAVTVKVRQHCDSRWTVTGVSDEPKRENASLYSWSIEVPAEGERKLEFKATFKG